LKADEEAKHAAQEEAAAQSRAEEEAAAQSKAEEEAAAQRKAEEEAAAQLKAEEEAAARHKAEAEAAAQLQMEEEAAAQSKAEEEAAAQSAAEDEAATLKAEGEAKHAAQEEVAAQLKVEEEAAAQSKAEGEAAQAKAGEKAAVVKVESDAAEARGAVEKEEVGAAPEESNPSETIGTSVDVGKIYKALYDYDPNDNAEKEDEDVDDELVLTAGCQLRVVEDMDDDGFFVCECLDGPNKGQQGFVPHTYVVLVGEDDSATQREESISPIELHEETSESPLIVREGAKMYLVATADTPAGDGNQPAGYVEVVHDPLLPVLQGCTIEVLSAVDEFGFLYGQIAGSERGGIKGYIHRSMTQPWTCTEEELVDFEARRLTKVLYDYTPEEHADEDVAVSEMSMIKDTIVEVYGEIDDIGYYDVGQTLTGALKGQQGEVPSNYVEDVTSLVSPDLYTARFSYEPVPEEGEEEEDLSFEAGDIIRFMTPNLDDPEGYYDAIGVVGKCTGVRGMVPINYVEQIPDVLTIPYFEQVQTALAHVNGPSDNAAGGDDEFA
jgi:chemotaxis protein histidine kinase CheA